MDNYTIKEFNEDFPDQRACFEYIVEQQRIPKCKKCRGKFRYYLKKRKVLACKCGCQFSPLKGTIFENSPLSLKKWFYAIFLMSQAKNGLSAKELQRHIGGSYKTSWRLCHEIRSLTKEKVKLKGAVAVDEGYMGSRMINKRKKGTNKCPVVGLVDTR